MLTLLDRYTNLKHSTRVMRAVHAITGPPKRLRARFASSLPDSIDASSSAKGSGVPQNVFDLPPELIAKIMSKLPANKGVALYNTFVNLLRAHDTHAKVIQSLQSDTLHKFLLFRHVDPDPDVERRIFQYLFAAAVLRAPKHQVRLRESIEDLPQVSGRQRQTLDRLAEASAEDEALSATLAAQCFALPVADQLPFFTQQRAKVSNPEHLALLVPAALRFDPETSKAHLYELLGVPNCDPYVTRALASTIEQAEGLTTAEVLAVAGATHDAQALVSLGKHIGVFARLRDERLFTLIESRNASLEVTRALASQLTAMKFSPRHRDFVQRIADRSQCIDPRINRDLAGQIEHLPSNDRRLTLFDRLFAQSTTDAEYLALVEQIRHLAPNVDTQRLRGIVLATNSEAVHAAAVAHLSPHAIMASEQYKLFFDLLETTTSELVLTQLAKTLTSLPHDTRYSAFEKIVGKSSVRDVQQNLAASLKELRAPDRLRAMRTLRETAKTYDVLEIIAKNLHATAQEAPSVCTPEIIYREVRAFAAEAKAIDPALVSQLMRGTGEWLCQAMPRKRPSTPEVYPGEHRSTALRHLQLLTVPKSEYIQNEARILERIYLTWNA